MNELLTDIAHTPSWVWLVLALLIWRGLKATQPRDVGLVGLLLMPAILVGLSCRNLFGSGVDAGTMAGLALGALLGLAAGLTLERRYGATVLGNGRVRLPGEWTQIVVVLSIFGMHYAKTVIDITHPELAQNAGLVVALAGMSAFFGTMLLTRTVSRLWVAFGRTPALTA